jgi:hypothetical protein
MSAQNGVNEYWAGFVHNKRKELLKYLGVGKKQRLVIMLRDNLPRELAGLNIYEQDKSLSYAAELLGAWQQIIEEVTA